MSWLKSFTSSLSRSSFSQDDTSLSPAKQTSPGKRLLHSLKKSSSVSSLRSHAEVDSTTPPCSPSRSLRRSRSSVRSILKKSSTTNLAEIATPSRSVKFTASTSEAREHNTPVPASYHFGDETAEPYFYKTEIDWSGHAEVIVDSPPHPTGGEDLQFEQEGELFDSFALDQMSPPKTAHSSPGTPAAPNVPRSQSFLNRLKAAIPSPEASLLASSIGSSASLPGYTKEWTNLIDNSLPDQQGSSTLAESTSSERDPSATTVNDFSRQTVVQSPDQSRTRSLSPDRSAQLGPETSFTTPGKAALHGMQTSRSFNSLASFSTPGSSQEKASSLGAESRRSINTKVNLLKRDGDRVCDEFGISSPEERYSTPSSTHNKRRRSSISPVKVAGLPFRPPPNQTPVKVPVSESESLEKHVAESIIETPAEKSSYFSPMAAEPLPDVGPSPTKSSFPSLSPPVSVNQSSSSMDITDCQSPSKPASFSADTSLQDLFTIFSSQHSALTSESATHRSLVLDLLKQLQKDSEAKDKRLVNLKKQVDLAEQGWSDAIEEAGRWEEEQLAHAGPDVEELQRQKKDLEIRLEHASRSCREALEKVEQMDGMSIELVRLRAEVDRAVQDGKDREVQMQGLVDGKEDEVNAALEKTESLERRLDELQVQLDKQSDVVRQKDTGLSALQQQQDTFDASRIEAESEEAKQSQWKISDLLSQLAVLRKHLDTAEANQQSAESKLEQYTKVEAEQQSRITSLQTELAEAHNIVEQHETLQADFDQAKIDFEAETAEKEELINQLNSNTEALEAVMTEKDNLEKELCEASQRCSRLEEHLRKAQDDIAALEDGTTGHLDRVERSQSKIDQLESGQDRLLNNLHDLEEQLDAKDSQLQQLTEKFNSERKEATAARQEAATVRQRSEMEVLQLKQDLVSFQQVPQSCAECASRAGSSSELQKEVERLSKAVAKMRFEASDREAKINRLSKAKAELKEDKEGLGLALEAKQQELSMLKRRRESRDPSVMPFTTAKSQRILRSHPSAQTLQEAETPMPNATKMQPSTTKRETLQPRRISFGQQVDQAPTLAKTGLSKKNSRGSIASVYGDAPRRPSAEKENTGEELLGRLPDVPRTRRSRSSAIPA